MDEKRKRLFRLAMIVACIAVPLHLFSLWQQPFGPSAILTGAAALGLTALVAFLAIYFAYRTRKRRH